MLDPPHLIPPFTVPVVRITTGCHTTAMFSDTTCWTLNTTKVSHVVWHHSCSVSWFWSLQHLFHAMNQFRNLSDIIQPPLWSSGQSFWLQIQRSGFDSRRYQIFWEVVGLEQGPLSTGCGRNNSNISKGDYKQMVRGITKNFLFPKWRYQKVFLL
jgi:hypothetical protein